jgi:hypothetical protein
MYKKLKAYNEKHGHCKVPIKNAKDPDQSVSGGIEAKSVRDRMPQSRKDLLDELVSLGRQLGYNVRTTCKVQTGTFTYRGSKKNIAWPGGAGSNGQDETEQASPERRGRMKKSVLT